MTSPTTVRSAPRDKNNNTPSSRPVWLRLAVLCLFLQACGGSGGDAPQDIPPRTNLRVTPGHWVVLGSSTAAGVGAPAGDGWVSRLAAQWRPQGVTVDNLARSLMQSSQALPVGSALPPGRPTPDATVNIDAALDRNPSLVILSFPTNDSVAGVAPADTVAAWQTMHDLAAAAGAATVVLSTQPRSGLSPRQRAGLADVDRRAALAFGPCFLPLHDALVGPDGSLAPAYSAGDGVHLNADGHALIEARVTALLTGGLCVAHAAG